MAGIRHLELCDAKGSGARPDSCVLGLRDDASPYHEFQIVGLGAARWSLRRGAQIFQRSQKALFQMAEPFQSSGTGLVWQLQQLPTEA